jgi:hypothetical protein
MNNHPYGWLKKQIFSNNYEVVEYSNIQPLRGCNTLFELLQLVK